MDEQTFEIARQYTQCCFEADEAIAHLIDIVDRCDEDTVVVYFGVTPRRSVRISQAI